MAALGNGKTTARQQAVLVAIAALNEPSQTDLVNTTGIDRSTIAEMVRRLCKEGIVARQRTRRDARRYALRLTHKGEKIAEAAARALSAAEREIMERVPPKLRSGLLDALRSICKV